MSDTILRRAVPLRCVVGVVVLVVVGAWRVGDGVITTDQFGCIDYMNPTAESLTGWRYHQAMGMALESVLHLEDEAC